MRSHPCMFSVKILHLLRMTAILLILRFYLLNLRSAQLTKCLFIYVYLIYGKIEKFTKKSVYEIFTYLIYQYVKRKIIYLFYVYLIYEKIFDFTNKSVYEMLTYFTFYFIAQIW